MKSYLNFIDGRASERANKLQPQLSPHAANQSFSFAQADFMDVVACVQSAHKAQKKWQETALAERIQILIALKLLIVRHIEVFIQFEHEDSGIPIEAARKLCEEALKKLTAVLDYTPPLSAQGASFQVVSPLGIIGLITDWQQSMVVVLENLSASLLCANLVILYPSEFAIRSVLKIAELASEAGLPNGVFNVLLGRGDGVSVDLCEHPGIKHLRFYGDNITGEKLHKIAAENNKRLTSYMGVNNAAVVFADADIKASTQKIIELCFEFHLHGRSRINRVLVQEKILKEFKTEFDLQLASFDVTKVGPLPSLQLKAEFESYLDQSKKDRAKIHDTHPQLTVYDDLTNCSTLHQQNLFGPILFLQSFKYAVDLPKVLGSGAFAFRTYIWTQDLSRIHKLSAQVEVSQIFFNPGDVFISQELISENLKQSGYSQNGIEALFEFNLNRRLIRIW